MTQFSLSFGVLHVPLLFDTHLRASSFFSLIIGIVVAVDHHKNNNGTFETKNFPIKFDLFTHTHTHTYDYTCIIIYTFDGNFFAHFFSFLDARRWCHRWFRSLTHALSMVSLRVRDRHYNKKNGKTLAAIKENVSTSIVMPNVLEINVLKSI